MLQKFLSLFFLAIIGLAHAITNLTSTGCADAAGFTECQNALAAPISACLARADADGSQLETLACGCENYLGNYNCYASHCWNRVNECEYQEYIVEYLVGCPTAKLPVPYFPTPNTAPDSCSCNLGDVYLAINNSIIQGTTCTNQVSATSLGNAANAVQEIQGCECCEISAALSSIYGLCPNTDPTLIGLSSVTQLETVLDTPFSSCGPFLSEFNCVSDLDFPEAAGGTFYNPSNLPASGTATLSNVAGTVTAPASGNVFTYTNGGDGQVYTISAASVTAGSNSGGSNGGVTGSNPATATGSSSGAVKTSVGEKIALSQGSLLVAFTLCFAALF